MVERSVYSVECRGFAHPRQLINPRRACAAKVTVVYDYSRTTGYEAAVERYQQLQCYKGKKTNVAIFAETTAFEKYGVKTSEKANMHNEHCLTSTRFSPFSAPWT